jgi:hypothetical protein
MSNETLDKNAQANQTNKKNKGEIQTKVNKQNSKDRHRQQHRKVRIQG